ncbi:MAG: CDP-alcohol phosphatidyltransferase [Bacteroidales bacterium]|nr:CDP-alcohol phosphatidyltransferase [Bacteroidales bacterium]
MKKDNNSLNEALNAISKGRERTNIMKKYEQKTIAFLVQYVPSFISSDMLTAIGLVGNLILGLSFILGAFLSPYFLLLGIIGSFINWYGDSLDGRLAYYRNTPRKWYGFSLDIIIDWIGITVVGAGFMIYLGPKFSLIGYAFIVMYALEIIIALLRYKTNDKYSIDSGLLGPTEVRLVICLVLVLEVLFSGSFLYFAILSSFVLFISNIKEISSLLKLADLRDKQENENNNKNI